MRQCGRSKRQDSMFVIAALNQASTPWLMPTGVVSVQSQTLCSRYAVVSRLPPGGTSGWDPAGATARNHQASRGFLSAWSKQIGAFEVINNRYFGEMKSSRNMFLVQRLQPPIPIWREGRDRLKVAAYCHRQPIGKLMFMLLLCCASPIPRVMNSRRCCATRCINLLCDPLSLV